MQNILIFRYEAYYRKSELALYGELVAYVGAPFSDSDVLFQVCQLALDSQSVSRTGRCAEAGIFYAAEHRNRALEFIGGHQRTGTALCYSFE